MSSTKEKKDDLLQAVVIVDTWWGDAFFASGKPRALIPLANVPLLDYTLECLDRCGVGQTFVFCCNYYVEVWQYLRASSKWLNDSSTTMNVSVLTADNCLSVGDVLRDLDNRSLVRSDFLLVSGNLVSNANLKTIVERAIECFARRRLSIDAFAATFSFVVQYLYKMDVLSEDCILLWWTSLSTNDDVRAKIKPFINWLKTAEEESDDDE